MLWKFKRTSVWKSVVKYRSFLREIYCFKINPSPKLLTDSSVKTPGVGKYNHPRRRKIGSFSFKKWLFYLKKKWILPDIICTFQIGVFCFKRKLSLLAYCSVTYFHLTSVSKSGHKEILHCFHTVGIILKFISHYPPPPFSGYKHFCEKYPSS